MSAVAAAVFTFNFSWPSVIFAYGRAILTQRILEIQTVLMGIINVRASN